jgi:DNA modification methylase
VDYIIKDIKPYTPVASPETSGIKEFLGFSGVFDVQLVGELVGMSPTFIKKVVGHGGDLRAEEVLLLLDQDSFAETYIPRSKIPLYLLKKSQEHKKSSEELILTDGVTFLLGNAYELLHQLKPKSVQCVVTSTPYWAMRLYDDMQPISWADGEVCPFGMEQTPEAFIRHTVEFLAMLKPLMSNDGSVWWNIMDTFNTRTQIRNNAVEALRAMQGKDKRKWTEHDCRRYSAGHSYLKDGEQSLIPMRIAERASRIGYFIKTFISWTKTSTLPEPQNSRVSRNIEYVLHLTLQRTPRFYKEAYRDLPAKIGGRNGNLESDKLSDFWYLPTSTGKDGHGAQFPLALPGRCIALSTDEDDLVLDPFCGAGNSGIASKMLNRRFLGFDISSKYIEIAQSRMNELEQVPVKTPVREVRSQNGHIHEVVQGAFL